MVVEYSSIAPLQETVERYFALMYDNDVSHFDRIFAPSAQLHGIREGELRIIPARDYKEILASRASPKARGAPRLQEILLVDFASPTQAVVKVRVRISDTQYLDQLSLHCIQGAWLITAKSFHIERKYDGTQA